jgi:hypothetical protein
MYVCKWRKSHSEAVLRLLLIDIKWLLKSSETQHVQNLLLLALYICTQYCYCTSTVSQLTAQLVIPVLTEKLLLSSTSSKQVLVMRYTPAVHQA